jgi:LEA14-like dessication related protein
MDKAHSRWCLITLVLLLLGCAGFQQNMERPRINIANVMPRDIKFFEQVFDLELRIQNPNDTPLEVNGLAFDLELNGKRFATGVSNQSLVIDRLSSGVIHVEAITTLVGFLRQVAEYQQTQNPRVAYRIKGSIYSGSPSVKLRFDDSGEIKIPIEPTKQKQSLCIPKGKGTGKGVGSILP